MDFAPDFLTTGKTQIYLQNKYQYPLIDCTVSIRSSLLSKFLSIFHYKLFWYLRSTNKCELKYFKRFQFKLTSQTMIYSYLIQYNKGAGLNLAEKWILCGHFPASFPEFI